MNSEYGYVKDFVGVPVFGIKMDEKFELYLHRCQESFNINLYDTTKKDNHNVNIGIEDMTNLVKFLTLELEEMKCQNK